MAGLAKSWIGKPLQPDAGQDKTGEQPVAAAVENDEGESAVKQCGGERHDGSGPC